MTVYIRFITGFFLLFIGIHTALPAARPHREQAPPHRTSPGLVLMNCSAHPDDEDGATLAYYQHLKGIKTYSIFFTRGEGGQNETGPELGRDLGVLRTRETLRAARILGTQAYFLDFPDFGFSKTASETFAKWKGRDRVLAKLVYYIRSVKPDVIITNHDTVTTPPNRQHGNHQAVGITVLAAFDSAASPTFHPEQLKNGVTVWQVRKLYFRAFRQATADSVVTLDLDKTDSSGRSMARIAIEALAQHKTQGMDKITLEAIPQRFRQHRYTIVRSDKKYPFDAADLFSGIAPAARTVAAIRSPIDTIPRPAQKDTLPSRNISVVVPKGITVGLIKTYDNTTQQILDRFSVRYRIIDSAYLASGSLNDFSTIILDIRAYEYRHDLAGTNQRLLDYVKNGGNLLCMYHKAGDWNGKNYAPLQLTLSDERVTEEDAAVTILEPTHPFFSTPNPIGAADWTRWVQERSLYLPSNDTSKTSPVYHRLLGMSDTGEQQPPTSILWAQAGKGTYTYVSLALYRQLRILNQGGVRLFMNMIAQPRH
jgi:LmbE family N-acetylglucosaminyl deacetylase